MPDFTLTIYTTLLTTLRAQNYSFQPLEELPFTSPGKIIVLRHDVDLKPDFALQTARLENQLGIRGTYYFRIVPGSNKPSLIREIAELGHEIGYHYEDLTLIKGNVDKAYERFSANLEYFRQFYPVRTACMHGSPTSRWDSRDIWKKYDYREPGIICEPYFDTDFKKVLYLTDTGRRWDGWKVNVRDKMPGMEINPYKELSLHATSDIITAANSGTLPEKIMFNIHPQRWTNKPLPWIKELLLQNTKNIIKRILVSLRAPL